MHRSFRATLALGLLLLGARQGHASLDLSQLRAHAAGRQLVLAGDVAGAQAAWDGILTASGPVTALVIATPCGEAELAASLQARRALSPLWVAGTPGGCHVVAWGAFASDREAAQAAEILAPGMLPAPLRTIVLSRPLSAIRAENAHEAGIVDAAPVRQPEAPPQPVRPAEPPPREKPEPVAAEPSREDPSPAAGEPAPEEPQPAPERPAASPGPAARQEPEPVKAPAPETSEPAPLPPASWTVAPSTPREEPRAPEPREEQPRSEEPAAEEPPPPAPVRAEPHVPATPEPGESAALLFAQGNAEYARGNYDAAIRNFEKALVLEPGNPRSWNNLGTTWLLKREPVEAEKAFRKALELDPGYARAHLNLGSALYGQSRPVEARREFERAVEIDAQNVDAHYNLAALLVDMGLLSDAAQALRSGLEVNPGNPVLQGYLADVERQARAQGVDVQPPAPPGASRSVAPASRGRESPCGENVGRQARAHVAARYFTEGRAAYDRGDWLSAEVAFEDALSCDPTSVPILNFLGAARLRAGDTDGASAALDLATTLDPASVDAGVNLALAFYAKGDCDAAVAHLEKLDGTRAGSSEVKFQQGRLLYKCGRVTEATAALQEAERRDPADTRARRLLDEIDRRQVDAP